MKLYLTLKGYGLPWETLKNLHSLIESALHLLSGYLLSIQTVSELLSVRLSLLSIQ
jgi:hypothetical protein